LPKELSGTWVYRLGPNTLFALHLEAEKDHPDQLQGYLLYPDHFYINSPGGSVLQFSKLTNHSKRELIVSTEVKEGQVRLEEVSPSAKPENKGSYTVRAVDSTHVALTLFPSLPSLRMERTADQPQLFDHWDSTRTYSPDDFLTDNPQMASIVAADQADRKDGMHIDWQAVNITDGKRRLATKSLLQKGELHTGHDFENAALVFQHSDKPDDYLLAHALAMVAVSKGQKGAVWISAATLDRYLQSIGRPQIFGTQFSTLPGKLTTQEPYNRTLVSDSLRGYMGVPSAAAQDAQRKQYDEQRGLASTPK
jgi:hypothetical protein